MSPQPALIAAFLVALVWQSPAQADCKLQPDVAAWINSAADSWDRVRRDDLHLEAAPRPWAILFDASCAWHMNRGGASSPLEGVRHNGRLTLPDETAIEAKLTSFAATYGADDRPYVVMALPDIWRRDPRHQTNPDLDRLMRSVFVHEMTHTLQAHSTGERLNTLQARYTLPADLTDDIIQQRFAAAPGFRQAYETERDILFRAAEERDPIRRRRLIAEAVDAIEARRSGYFVGADAVYADLEDLFLNMEGVANWAAYRAARLEGQSHAEAVKFIRGDGKRWSQDEGLALFLAIDAALPEWQPRVFGPTSVSVLDLLRTIASPRQ